MKSLDSDVTERQELLETPSPESPPRTAGWYFNEALTDFTSWAVSWPTPSFAKPCPVGGLQWCESLNGVSIRQKADKVWEAWLDSRLSVTQQYREEKATWCYCKTWARWGHGRESLKVLTICKARSWSMPRGWLRETLSQSQDIMYCWMDTTLHLGEVEDGKTLRRSWLALVPSFSAHCIYQDSWCAGRPNWRNTLVHNSVICHWSPASEMRGINFSKQQRRIAGWDCFRRAWWISKKSICCFGVQKCWISSCLGNRYLKRKENYKVTCWN